MLGYNMGKADLTNLFIEGQKVSLEAVNITVDDRKKYPGEQKVEMNDENAWRSNTSAEPHLFARTSSNKGGSFELLANSSALQKKMMMNTSKRLKNCMSRLAVPIQAPSNPGLDEQVPAKKRHRQNCSRVRSRQQLVYSSFSNVVYHNNESL